MTGKTILLVEDNPKVMRNNITMLISRGATILAAENLAEARLKLASFFDDNHKTAGLNVPDAAAIDIMLPDGSGLDLLHEIRKVSSLPILLLTAKGASQDIVTGLSLGADDYLAKPYDLNVFVARLSALLRRSQTVNDSIGFGPLYLDLISNQAFYKGKDLLLTQKEFALLFVLIQNKDNMISADSLYEKVWGLPVNDGTSALKVHMSNLKKKLSVTGNFVVETTRGEGYHLIKI